MKYIEIDAEENIELTKKYGVMQAPTLVMVEGDKVQKVSGASDIKKLVSENMLVNA